MVFSFLRTKKPGTSYLKPAFSRQLVAVGAYRRRPSGGRASAGAFCARAGGREGLDGLIWNALSISRPPPHPNAPTPPWKTSKKQKSNKAKCRRKEASEALKAETPVPKEADQKRSRLRQMPCCNSPLLPSRQQKGPSLLVCAELTTESPATSPLAPACKRHWASQPRFSRARNCKKASRFLLCCCPLCFLCLLLSDDKQKLAFINAVYLKKRNREGRRSSRSRRTKKARQQQQRQHLR